MTPKAHALLSSIAAIKDAAADEHQDAMSTMDDVEAGRISIEEALPKLRGNVTRLSHSVISAHDTAAVLAEPMSIPPAPVIEPAPEPAHEAEIAPQAGRGTDETASSEAEQSSADPGPGLYTSRRKGDRTAV